MASMMIACIIMHNMIIEDEYDDPMLNDQYLFEPDETSFRVDPVRRTIDPADSDLISKHISDVRREYMSRSQHKQLKADLVEHLWSLRGNDKDYSGD
jgi:hypothetical protein